MSKQFESKKETATFIKKSYPENTSLVSYRVRYENLENQYKKLIERTKKLEQVYKFHKGIVQNISAGIITIDFNGCITFINTSALRAVEFSFNELVNTPIKNLFVDKEEAEIIIDALINQKNMYESKEVNLQTKTGKIIPIGFSSTFLKDQDSAYQGVILSFRDLTNLISFRTQMERMDRLATLGEVSAGIAHEIRNPLAGIKTSAQVLEESFGPGDFRAELVKRLVKEIDRSNELLKKFFNFAKPGKPKFDYTQVEMLVDGVYLLLASKMKKKNIIFTKLFADDLPEVYVDENQIEQVLINLYMNAIDAMQKGGTLIIRTSQVEQKIKEERQTMVRIDIEDSGKGIDQNNLERIFNPFFTTKSDGVGLGLSISSRLIEENGGKMEVESSISKGTKFSLYLPIHTRQ
jgi:two-component system sensor histidine kinase AtoS